MKIIGFTYINGQREMVMKGDSSLLVNRKPFFIPTDADSIAWTPCIALRVSRLGKGIAEKFAYRYWDAFAPGIDWWDAAKLNKAQKEGRSWTEALCFDYSLAIGEWTEGTMAEAHYAADDLVITPEEAIHLASKTMTIRQGDIIYIDRKQDARPAHVDEVLTETVNGEEKLYCKVK